jgi:hypothetical protein
MPVAFVQEFAATGDDRSTTNYDAVAARVMPEGDWPTGMIFHTAGWDEDRKVFRIFDVWETREDSQRFMDERVGPIMQELAGDRPAPGPPPDRQYFYELHHLVKQ